MKIKRPSLTVSLAERHTITVHVKYKWEGRFGGSVTTPHGHVVGDFPLDTPFDTLGIGGLLISSAAPIGVYELVIDDDGNVIVGTESDTPTGADSDAVSEPESHE